MINDEILKPICDEDGKINKSPNYVANHLLAHGVAIPLANLIAEMEAKSNRASTDRYQIFKDFEAIDQEAAQAAKVASFGRLNSRVGIASSPPSDTGGD